MHSYVLFFFMPTAFNFSSVKQNTTINAMSWEYLMLSQYHIASINLMFCAFQIYLLVKLCRNKWKLWVSLKTGFRILRQINFFFVNCKSYLIERKLLYHTPHRHVGIPSGTWRFYRSLWRVAWSSAPNCQCTMLCNEENFRSFSRILWNSFFFTLISKYLLFFGFRYCEN